MKHWVQYSKELKIMGLPLASPSAISVRPRLHFMVIDLTRKASSRTQRRYKLLMNVTPPPPPPSVKDRGEKFSLIMTGYLPKFIPWYASLTKQLIDLTRTETKFHWGPTEDKAFKEVKGAITSKGTIAFFNPKLPIMVRVEATILDKTVEKIAYLGAFFLNFVADRFFPPPLPLGAVLLGLQKKAGFLSICRKQL